MPANSIVILEGIMRTRFTSAIIVLLALSALSSTIIAATETPELTPADATLNNIIRTGPIGLDAPDVTFIPMLGGSLGNGDFQDGAGSPDDDGWTSVDLTSRMVSAWHVDNTYSTSLSMWCSQQFSHECSDLETWGYGNNWNEALLWEAQVFSAGSVTGVLIETDLNYDMEPGVDFLYLEYESDTDGWLIANEWTGSTWNETLGSFETESVSEPIIFDANDYPGTNLARVRWRFESNAQNSDEDCGWPSKGAVQLDNIVVSGDNGIPMTFDDFESGSYNWATSYPEHFGDYAQVLPYMTSLDPLGGNGTPVFGFIDDGVVQSTTVSYGTSWSYNPYVVNTTGGLAGDEDLGIHNEIRSPEITWLEGSGGMLAFDVYSHMPHGTDNPDIYYYWSVRSANETAGETLADAVWRNDRMAYYSTSPRLLRFETDVTPYLQPGATKVQVALGVIELNPESGRNDATPAPFFDNVQLDAFEYMGPALAVRKAHLAQDNFPAFGEVDLSILSNNGIKFDMAMDVAGDDPWIQPGEALIVDIAPTTTNTTITSTRMVLEIQENPLGFGRTPMPLDVPGVQCVNDRGEPIANRYQFDLDGTNYIFPGDIVHYYFEAMDSNNDIHTLPEDPTGFNDFSDTTVYPEDFTMRGLPSIFMDGALTTPSVLLIADNPDDVDMGKWYMALKNLGLDRGTGYDLYRVQEPASGVSNGIGSRATVQQLESYDIILYSSGTLMQNTLGMENMDGDKSPDVQRLENWLYTPGHYLFLTGDHLVKDLLSGPAAGATFVAANIGVSYEQDDVQALLMRNNIEVQTTGAGLFTNPPEWSILDAATVYRGIDAVMIAGATRQAEFLDSSGNPGAYPYAAATSYANFGSQVTYMPYDLTAIGAFTQNKTTDMTRANILNDVLIHAGAMTGPGTGIVDPASCIVSGFTAEPVSIFCLPDRGGFGLEHAFTDDGEIVDATIIVQINDDSVDHDPIAGYPAEDIWLQPSGGVVIPAGGAIADGPTDYLGDTTFSKPLALGGTSAPGTFLEVVVDGVALPTILQYAFNSCDITGDLQVRVQDTVIFKPALVSPAYNYEIDFFRDGVENLSDIVLYVQSINRSWPTARTPIIPPSGTTPEQALFFSLWADQEGTTTTVIEIDDGYFTAYPKMYLPTSSTVGGLSFALNIDPAITLVDYVPPGGSHFDLDYGEFIVAFSEPITGGGLVDLGEMIFMIPGGGPYPEDLEISIIPHPTEGLIYADGSGQLGVIYSTGTTHVNPTASANILVVPIPNDIPAPWVLSSTRNPDVVDQGMVPLSGIDPDTYTIVWGDVENYLKPEQAEETQFVDVGDNAVFVGNYTPLGIIEIDPQPVGVAAPWTLTGPDEYEEIGTGPATFTNIPAGSYTLLWEEVVPWVTPPPETVDFDITTGGQVLTFTGLYLTPIPQSILVEDVPEDQGRYVRITWDACDFDYQDNELEITGYSIYRKHPLKKSSDYTPPTEAGGILGGPDKLLGWDFLTTIPAQGDATYSYVAMTLCDWTDEDPCETTFLMRVLTSDNYTYFTSPEFTGASIDNLSPGVPQMLNIAYNADSNVLTWGANEDPDVSHYRIYRADWTGDDPPAFPGGEPFAEEAGLSWTDPLADKSAWDYFYFLTAVDHNGNESEPTESESTATSGVNNPDIPKQLALHPCYPNPFNPSTTIRFDLPEATNVRLEIYDLHGRCVRVLRDGANHVPGRHTVVWDGRTDDQAAVATGVYFCRLVAGDMTKSIRMTLLK
jgi:FlgD Ig-like domain